MIQLLIIWLIGMILSFLAISWTEISFKLNIDKDGIKVLCSIFWIFVLVYEIFKYFIGVWDDFVEKTNSTPDTKLDRVSNKLGNFIRSFK